MSLFKNLLFLHGHFTDPHMDDNDGPADADNADAALAAASGPVEGASHVCNDAG